MMGYHALNHIVPTMIFPIDLNQIELKSVKFPESRKKLKGCSERFALTRSNKKAVLKN